MGARAEMATFSNTFMPPTVRLGDTADPIATVSRNTAAALAMHVELIRPVIERAAQPPGAVIEFKRTAVRRRAKRSAR